MSSSSSPCAACKCLRRKCTQECAFAPYFPADQPQKFANVHKVFGASNVTKLLNELNVTQRDDAVNSLAYEAEFRLRDPVYGCVGLISVLKHKLDQVEADLSNAKKELATFIGPSAMLPMFPANAPSPSVIPFNASPMLGLNPGPGPGPSHGGGAGPVMIRDPQQYQQQQQQQMMEAQQLAAMVAAREQQELMRRYEQQQQQQPPQQNEFVRFNGPGFDPATAVTVTGGGGYNQVTTPGVAMSPSLALASYEPNPYQIQQQQQQDHPHPHTLSHSHSHAHLQFQSQIVLQQPQQQQQQQPQQQQRSGSEEGKVVSPTC